MATQDTATEDPFERCAHCGAVFEPGVRYPVTTRRDGDGLEVYSFCDCECQAAWDDGD